MISQNVREKSGKLVQELRVYQTWVRLGRFLIPRDLHSTQDKAAITLARSILSSSHTQQLDKKCNVRTTGKLCVKYDDADKERPYVLKLYEGKGEKKLAIQSRAFHLSNVYETLRDIRCPALAMPVDIIQTNFGERLYLIYKCASKLSLQDRLEEGSPLHEQEIAIVLRTLISALKHLSSLKIIHTSPFPDASCLVPQLSQSSLSNFRCQSHRTVGVTADHIVVMPGTEGKDRYLLSGLEHCFSIEDWQDCDHSQFNAYSTYSLPILLHPLKDLYLDTLYTYTLGTVALSLFCGKETKPRELLQLEEFLDSQENLSPELKEFLLCCLAPKERTTKTLQELEATRFYKGEILPNKVLLQFPSRYVLKGVFESGVFYKWYHGVDTITKEEIVVRKLKIKKRYSAPKKVLLMSQNKILKDMQSNPFVVNYLDAFEVGNKAYAIFKYVNGLSLSKYLDNNTLTAKQMLCVAWFIANALDRLHETSNTMHRDVKPDNILLVLQDNDIRAAKLTNFLVSAQGSSSAYVGTFAYMAPEVQRCQSTSAKAYDTKADVWSFGILLYFLRVGKTPLDVLGGEEFARRINPPSPSASLFSAFDFPGNSKFIPDSKELPSFDRDLGNLLEYCLQLNPSERVSMKKVLEHPWFRIITKLERKIEHNYLIEETLPKQHVSLERYTARRKGEEQLYTIIQYPIGREDSECQQLEHKLALWKSAQYLKYTPELKEAFIYQSACWLVTTHCNYPTLRTRFKQPGVSSDRVLHYAKQILLAIREMNCMGICHRGLKPDSIALKEDGGIMILDFDHARIAIEKYSTIRSLPSIYLAPEYYPIGTEEHKQVVDAQHYYKGDIWSYGHLLFFMNYGQDVETSTERIIQFLRYGRFEYPSAAPIVPWLNTIIEDCLQIAPEKRPATEKILATFNKLLTNPK